MERIKSMTPFASSVKEFMQYVDAYFLRIVFGQKCKSWYESDNEQDRAVRL